MTDNERMNSAIDNVTAITNTDCLLTIINMAQTRRNKLLELNTLSWQVGDEVRLAPQYQNRKPYNTIGKIMKINRVKMVIDFGDFGCWNIPRKMLIKAE